MTSSTIVRGDYEGVAAVFSVVLVPIILMEQVRSRAIADLFRSRVVTARAMRVHKNGANAECRLVLRSPRRSFLKGIRVITHDRHVCPFRVPRSVGVSVVTHLSNAKARCRASYYCRVCCSFRCLFSFVGLRLSSALSYRNGLRASVISRRLYATRVRSMDNLCHVSSWRIMTTFYRGTCVVVLLNG